MHFLRPIILFKATKAFARHPTAFRGHARLYSSGLDTRVICVGWFLRDVVWMIWDRGIKEEIEERGEKATSNLFTHKMNLIVFCSHDELLSLFSH